MADYLVEMGKRPWLKKMVGSLGIPLPMPQSLARPEGPSEKACLAGKTVLSGGAKDDSVAGALKEAGADKAKGDDPVDGLLFDGSDFAGTDDLAKMYKFFHENIRRVKPNGRIVVIGSSSNSDAASAASSAAITGFIKSCAKEVGKKGATANALYVEAGVKDEIAGPLRFLLSEASAFVDGQTLAVAKSGAKAGAKWDQPLAGQTALVTGGGRGIGAATARRLAADGAKVIILDIPALEDEAKAVAKEIDAEVLALDITSKGAAAKMFKFGEKHGGLDIVVNNAGVTRDKTLANMKPELWNLAIDVNLKAALEISEHALSLLADGGRVICLSSIAGIAGNFGQTNYGTAKAGLIGAVKALAPEFAKKKATINAVAPGFIETQMTAAIPFGTREAGRRLSSLGQGGLPEDVANVINFFASPGSAGLNGQILRICGGSYIGA